MKKEEQEEQVARMDTKASSEDARTATTVAPGSTAGAGVRLIAAERQRQIEAEGYDAAHDDEHGNGELAMAAACYAAPEFIFVKEERANTVIFTDPWPFELRSDKRACYGGNRLRAPWNYDAEERVAMLVKAGALIAAEIDRILRPTPKAKS